MLNNPKVHVVGIQGFGGTGKSTIASYLYQNTDFTDKYKFWADVSLKPDFTIFAEKVITAFGGKVTHPIDITQLINDLLHLLSQRRCLLVIDNLETLIDVERNWQDEYYQRFFSRWLRQGTTSTLLITTREKPQSFQGLQHWYSLGGMKIAEGITLLTKLGIIGTATELEDFVRYVDGHPLTIELVAGYLREYCGSQLSQVAELELEQFDLAYEEAQGSFRNQKDARLSWIIQQHLNRLTPEQKNFLIDLSVYRLPFNREAASYIWIEEKVKSIVIQKKLQELCNRSLLTKTQDNRYLFQTLVREYLYQQQKQDLTIAHQQAIQYYQLHLKEEQSWQIREDVSEYLEIIYHYCELEQYAKANEAINICYEFLDLRGYYSVLVELYEKLADRWQFNLKPEERYDYAWVLTNLGTVERYLGKVERTIEFYNQSLEIFQDIGDHFGIAGSLMGLGNAYYSLGDYPQAIDYYQQSLEIKREIGDRSGIANSLNNLGNAYYSLGDYPKAIDYYQQSLEIQQEIGNRHGEANTWFNLGNSWKNLQRKSEAKAAYENARKLYQAMGLDKDVEECDQAIQSLEEG